MAPGQPGLAASAHGFFLPRWGLVPHWADHPRNGPPINARSETVFAKPAFREAVRRGRCLVPAQAFYEWKREGGAKQPFAIGAAGADVFAMAGIADRWRDPDTGDELDTLAILTCAPNAVMAAIHDRMPVILPESAWRAWLDPSLTEPGDLASLLAPCPAESLCAWPVGDAVNAVGNDGPGLLERASSGAPEQGSLF